ncbi:hypothetical protein EI94DRAFT_374983 [Lactarius quietus]|nr:hypothetical protein EI94DRAFT_374983 [Lactarius quietus]
MARLLRVGQFVTWPKLHMIKNRMRLERQIYLGRQATKTAQQGPSFRVSNEPASVGLQSNKSRAVEPQVESDDDDFDTRTLDAPEGWMAPTPPTDVRPLPSNNSSFLLRLRTQSFPGLTAPIRRNGRLFAREEPTEPQVETSGSSDTSSGEEERQRRAHYPGALRNRPDVRRIFADREGIQAARDDSDEEEDS